MRGIALAADRLCCKPRPQFKLDINGLFESSFKPSVLSVQNLTTGIFSLPICRDPQ